MNNPTIKHKISKFVHFLMTMTAIIILTGLFFYLISMGNEAVNIGDSSYLPSPTLHEINTYAQRLNKPPLDKLPWEDKQGRNIYEVRQEELATIGLAAYQAKYAEEQEY